MKISWLAAASFWVLASGSLLAGSQPEVPVYFDMDAREQERLSETGHLEFMASKDLAGLVLPEQAFLGYAGVNYTRLHIGFTEALATEEDYAVRVSGYLRKGSLFCELEGLIRFDRNHFLKEPDYGVDNKYQDTGIQHQGVVFGGYSLRTGGKPECAGLLEGRNRVSWMIRNKGALQRNNVGNSRFLRGDNQYAGVWRRQAESHDIVASWGEYRIPFSRPELDVGAGEFSVNPVYLGQGWQQD